MKKVLLTSMFACIFTLNAFCGINKTLVGAQRQFSEATTLSQYHAAKKKFQSAKLDVGYVPEEHDNAINEGIRKCNNKIYELSPRLSVNGDTSSATLNFNGAGGYETLSISTNQGMPYVSALPSWISVTETSSSSITIKCDANNSVSSRNDWFNINAGNKSIRINIFQSAGTEPKFEIYSIEFANVNKDNDIIADYGSVLYSSDMRYLKPRIKYGGLTSSQTKKVYTKVIRPDGTILSGGSSPSGYSQTYDVTFASGASNTYVLTGWGAENSSVYSAGVWKYELWIDGKMAYSENINIQSKGATYLRVNSQSSVSVSFGADGGTKTYTVSTDGDNWSTWGIPDFCEVINKTSTSFTLRCNPNTSSSSRSDYMKIVCGEKEVRIDVSQAAGASVVINRVWVDHNVYNGDEKGMMIHVDFDANGIKGHSISVIAYFEYSSGKKLTDYDGHYRTTDGQVAVSDSSNVTYDYSNWSDFRIFMPYSQLHMASGDYSLRFKICVNDNNTDKFMATSQYTGFTYSR